MLRRSSLLGVITAAALLFGQLSGVMHLVIVDHQRCPEHGELVHAPALAAVDANRQDATLAGAEAGEAHGHDHCACVAPRREVSPDHGPSTAVSIVFLAAKAPPADVAPLPADKRWTLAPKNSPPRAA